MILGSSQYSIKNLRGMVYKITFPLSGCALALFTWVLASGLKDLTLDRYALQLHPWTTHFYRPHEASVLNYVVLCLCMGVYGLTLYFRRGNLLRYLLKKRRTLAGRFPLLTILSSPLFFVLLNRHWEFPSRLLVSLYLLFIFFVPWTEERLKRMRSHTNKDWRPWLNRLASRRRFDPRYLKPVLIVLTVAVWCFLMVEPVKLFTGPVYVMNEFGGIYGETRIGEGYVNNRAFLALEEEDGPRAEEFLRANALEYVHQTNTRGQLHHIGHVLNPLNEYLAGKPLPDVYMQYGWGNTLLYKLTMDLFGGISVNNFYKCYLYYVIYGILFAALLLYLFRDTLFVFCGTLFYAACFYSISYLIFIIAPGIVPTIHLLDVAVLLLLAVGFRHGSSFWLLPAAALSGLAMYLNRQFGMVLVISMAAAALLWIWETRRGKARLLLSLVVVLVPYAVLSAPVFTTAVNSSSTLVYFLTGFLSFRPDSDVIFLTVLYLVISCYFLFLVRRERHHLKYAFVFCFIYSLGVLTYFYWSGLGNHLAPVLPFAGVALLLMLRVAKELLPAGKPATALSATLALGALSLTLAYGSTLSDFYRGKGEYDENFRRHAVYRWDFPRAKFVTTMNPEPWRESIALIHKYSPGENSGIYLLSTYDKLLPFLAERYSLMPFFEMQWYLFSEKESAEAVSRLNSAQPRYLFVGNDLSTAEEDPWSLYFADDDIEKERSSNEGRRLELANIFEAVEEGYEKVEEGALITVYRRKTLPDSAPGGIGSAN